MMMLLKSLNNLLLMLQKTYNESQGVAIGLIYNWLSAKKK